MPSVFRRLIGLAEPPSPSTRRQRLSLPAEEEAIYAIGDVHGSFDEFRALEEMIVADARGLRTKTIIVLGDIVDRGPRSASVLEYLSSSRLPGFNRLVLLGNHEAAMLAFLDEPRRGSGWLEMGGRETLASYGIPMAMTSEHRKRLHQTALAAIPAGHLAFLRALPILATWRNYLFVHAGIRPGIALDGQADRDLIEIRAEFTESTADHGSIVVHGHTPTVEPECRPNRIGVDIAAYATGRLAAAKLTTGAPEFLVARRTRS